MLKKRFKTPERGVRSVNLRKTYNTVAKRKRTNHDLQNTIKLKIEKYKHHKKVEVNSGVPKKL